MPAYRPDGQPPDQDAVIDTVSQEQILAELLTLTWEFLNHASPTTRDELRTFLSNRGYHPQTCLGWFLDSLQLNASRLHQTAATHPPAN